MLRGHQVLLLTRSIDDDVDALVVATQLERRYGEAEVRVLTGGAELYGEREPLVCIQYEVFL